MSLLTIVQDAADRLGLARPSTVISNTQQLARTLLGLAQTEGKELMENYDWQVLKTEYTFSTAADDVDYSLPSDFDRLIPDTVFNRTQRRRVVGPISDEEWQLTQATLVTRVNPAFRIRGNLLLITPTPSAIETVAYEYISKNWCQDTESSGQTAWAADTDTGILDEELMTQGLTWRFKASKGQDYAESFNTYHRNLTRTLMRDGSRPRISTDKAYTDRVPTAPQVPETLVFP